MLYSVGLLVEGRFCSCLNSLKYCLFVVDGLVGFVFIWGLLICCEDRV